MSAQGGFIERCGLWTADERAVAHELEKDLAARGIEAIRVCYPDPHGLLRVKEVSTQSFSGALRNGVSFTIAPFAFDTANAVVLNPFVAGGSFGRSDMQGSPDAICVPDPRTFRMLPWSPGTGWILGDLYFGDTGEPFPWAPRTILRRLTVAAAEAGFDFLVGLEVEWYLTKIEDGVLRAESLGAPGRPADPSRVRPVARGFQLHLDAELDAADEIHRILRKDLGAAGLSLRTLEAEWGPGQQEMTLEPLAGLAAADAMIFLRSAVKQLCRRHGHHATFMCKPAIQGFFPSGWHLHQSLVSQASGGNAFVSADVTRPLSDVGTHFVGGLLEHAAASSAFATPTINGYRRRKPYSLAPDRATWGIGNRAAMVRVQGAPGDAATHLENRIGEPAANPYLYLASQLASGLDGVRRRLDPGPPSETPYAATDRPELPKTLTAALDALRADSFFREAFGDAFVDLFLQLEDSSVARFREFAHEHGLGADAESGDAVTEWEQREYFDLF